jgi:NADPH-dependent ferric siderophore reductase
MASGKALLGSLLGRLLFTQARVTEVTAPSANFRRVVLEGEGLTHAKWSPGDKIQVFLADGEMRTYTPLLWDAQRGLTALMLYVHGDAPGARWAKTVAPGAAVQFFGPRKSLKLAEAQGPKILFGDETSFGIAAAFWSLRQGSDIELMFEVSREGECWTVLESMDLKATLIERTPADAHLSVAVERLQAAQLAGFTPIFTGRAQAIQSMQRSLGRSFRGPTAAYWSLGKRGLD